MAKQSIKPININALIKAIQSEILQGQDQAKSAVEKQKVVTYWKIGKYIHIHLLYKENNTDYGEYLFPELSKATGLGLRILYRMVQFYEAFPKLVLTQIQLTWTHYKLLLGITNPDLRSSYEDYAIKNALSTRELEVLLRNANLLITYNSTFADIVLCHEKKVQKSSQNCEGSILGA